MRNNRFLFIRWLLGLSYLVIFYGSLLLTIRLRYGYLDDVLLRQHLIAFSLVYVLWLVLFYLHNQFELKTLQRLRVLIASLSSALTFCLIAAVVYFYFQPGLILTPRRFLLLHIVITGVVIAGWQLIIRQIFRRAFIEKFYLYATNPVPSDFLQELRSYEYIGMQFAGVINQPEIDSLAATQPISIALPEKQDLPSEVLKKFYQLRQQNITFYDYPTLYENLSRKVYLPGLNEAWFLTHINYRKKRLYQFMKRILDLVAGVLGLVVLVVVYPLVLVAIKLTSPGPVLFRQQRVGQYGTIITVYKFRSMSGEITDTWTSRHDPRITPIGRILRRTRIDELPQAINLLQGTMSLVGPRPEQPHIVAEMERQIPFYEERHVVKPGLTGWGQLNVYARSVAETKTKLQYDLYYIKHRSLGFDLEIILKTFYHIFTSNSG